MAQPDCQIIDTGHVRQLDLAIEVPPIELSAVCSNEQWHEIYKRSAELINAHRSTLVFVNTRRMAERISYVCGNTGRRSAVASHHGSLSREIRLCRGRTAQKGRAQSDRRHRVAGAGHRYRLHRSGVPDRFAAFDRDVSAARRPLRPPLGRHSQGPAFCADARRTAGKLGDCPRRAPGRLDRVEIPLAPLDILAQQIVAEVAAKTGRKTISLTVPRSLAVSELGAQRIRRIVASPAKASPPAAKGAPISIAICIHHELKARRGGPADRAHLRRRDPGNGRLSRGHGRRRDVRRNGQ